MSGPRMEVLLWAKRICAKRTAEPHEILEVSCDATLEVAQQAFHGIARIAHPDLHRTTCTPDELELVTSAFSLVSASYQQFRAQRMATSKINRLRTGELPKHSSRPDSTGLAGMPPIRTQTAKRPTGESAVLVVESTSVPSAPAKQMSSRALVHYRKAELALRRGDLPAATLHLKMAIATDPQSTFLRSALREVATEVAKKP